MVRFRLFVLAGQLGCLEILFNGGTSNGGKASALQGLKEGGRNDEVGSYLKAVAADEGL